MTGDSVATIADREPQADTPSTTPANTQDASGRGDQGGIDTHVAPVAMSDDSLPPSRGGGRVDDLTDGALTKSEGNIKERFKFSFRIYLPETLKTLTFLPSWVHLPVSQRNPADAPNDNDRGFISVNWLMSVRDVLPSFISSRSIREGRAGELETAQGLSLPSEHTDGTVTAQRRNGGKDQAGSEACLDAGGNSEQISVVSTPWSLLSRMREALGRMRVSIGTIVLAGRESRNGFWRSMVLQLFARSSKLFTTGNLQEEPHVRRAVEQAKRGSQVLKQALHTEGTALLNEAIDALHLSISDLPEGHSIIPDVISNLAVAFHERFQRLGKIDDLEEAISLGTHSLSLTSDEDPDKPSRLSNLGNALEARFERLGKIDDLEKAISLKTRSVDLTPDGNSGKPVQLNNLGNAFQVRFVRLGEISDLERAISLKTRSVDLTPDEHPHKPILLNNLGAAFQVRFARLGEVDDLDRAISLVARSVDLTPNGHPAEPHWLDNLGNIFQARFDYLGEISDLDKAISLQTRSVNLTPDEHPYKPRWLNSLGTTFQVRFKRLGEIDDLEQAISLSTRAVDLTLDGHPSKIIQLNSLGNAFRARFDHLGEIDDLEKAMLLATRSVDLTPDGHPSKPPQLNNLGDAFRARFDHLGKIDDLDKAILLKTRSVDLTPDEHPDKPRWLNNLGNGFHARFDRLGEVDDLEKAILLRARCIDLTPDGHPDKPGMLDNLGRALRKRFRLFYRIGDIEHAVQNLRLATKLTDDNDPARAIRLMHLADSLQDQFSSGGGHAGSSPEAVEVLEAAVTAETSPTFDRFLAIHRLIALLLPSESHMARNQTPHDKLISAYEHAFILIPQLVWLGSSITRRYELLVDIADVTSGAASAAIAVGELTRAVEWMEQGRGVIWGQLLQLRSPVDDLYAFHPSLAQQLQVISRQLEQSATLADELVAGDNLGQHSRSSQKDKVSTRIQLARDYQALLSEIRRLEGFKDFLRPKKYADIVPMCEDGPVVLINVHKSACDALVCLHADHIIHVPLRNIDQKFSQAMRDQFTSPIRSSGSHRHRIAESSDCADRGVISSLDEPLVIVLGALWAEVVLPILQAIEGEIHARAGGDLLYITWCATGPLAFLPIHAAGDYRTPGGMKIYDRVVSSYAPTLSSLRPPLLGYGAQSSAAKILAISQPSTPGHTPLKGTIDEISKLRDHFPGDEMIHCDHSDATVETILRAMDEHPCPYIHLACHGMQNADDPTKSAFMLYDGPLELARLMSKSADNAILAFLSACQTATGDAKLTEESVHLAAGMLAVGYRGVVGTMWSIHDDDAPLVADEFYRVFLRRQAAAAEWQGAASRSRVHAAYALHEATKKLRETVGVPNVLRWAPFAHFGK